MTVERDGLHPETIAVMAGRPPVEPDAPLNPPVVFASTYVGVAEVGQGERGYGRYGNPTWEALESAIGSLEGGRALAFSSGMAAVHAVFELLPQPAVLVLPENCYLGVSALAERRAARTGSPEIHRVDVSDTAGVLSAAEGADVVWIESPANPTMEVADLAAIRAGLTQRTTLVVDGTFATPVLQRPLAAGADVVLHSGTKFLSGHSDALLGVAVVRTDDTERLAALTETRSLLGAVPGTMEAYLVLRGIRTLPLRIQQAQASAQALAGRLVRHPAVRRVRYPGLATDPGHEVAQRALRGFGSLLSIELPDAATADRFVAGVRTWVHATSLGGVESTLERRRRWPTELKSVPEGLVRLSVGIEHVEDLWADLQQSLDALTHP